MPERLPRPRALRRHEIALGRALARLLVEPAQAEFKHRLVPLLERLARLEDEARADAIDDDHLRETVERAIDDAQSAHQATITAEAERVMRQGLRKVDRSVATTTDAQIAKAASDAVGRRVTASRARALLGVDPVGAEPWLGDVTAQAVSESLGKIQWSSAQVYERARREILADLRAGVRVEAIAKRIRDNYTTASPDGALAISRRRAHAIARNEVGNYTSALTRRRQEDLGVDRYTWRTSGDERVRGPGGKYPHAYPSHRKREGKVYRWDDPPSESPNDGHPGQPHGCRCTGEPYFEGLGEKVAPKRRRKRRG